MGRLSTAMEYLVEELRSSADTRRSELRALRHATRATLHRYGRERRDKAQQARRSARGQVAQIRGAAGELRQSARLAMGAIACDVRAATQLWRNTAAGLGAGPVSRTAAEAQQPPAAAAPHAPQRPSKLADAERVLEIVRAHVDGIRLVDMGNELGVDWRSLIGVTKNLLEEGKVEKIDWLYYPVED